MNHTQKYTQSIAIVRGCLQALAPDADFSTLVNDAPLFESRLLTSTQLFDLILLLEERRGFPVRPAELNHQTFHSIASIAQRFLGAEQ